MSKSIPNDGIVYFRGLFGQHCLLLTSPEALSEVLVRHSYSYTKPNSARKLFQRLFGRSLLVAEGDEHRYLRKKMQPAFSYANIQSLYPLLWSKAVDMKRELASHLKTTISSTTAGVDIWNWGNKAMLDAIGLAVLDVDLNNLRQPHELVEHYDTLTSAESGVQATFIAMAFLPSWIVRLCPGSAFKKLSKAGVELRRVCKAVIQTARSNVKEKDRTGHLLGLIRNEDFSDEELVDQFLLLIGAGHEPTSAAFAWLVWLLATHTEWQEKLRSELRATLHPSLFQTERFDKESYNLESLPILNGVCNETLRFMPTTPLTFRIAKQDTSILGTQIPRGARLFIAPYACNRSQAFYGPTAELFDPGRWINNDGKPNHHGGASSNYAFLTFLHGPRKCIGDGYAKAALRAFAAVFVASFEFRMADEGTVPTSGGLFATKPTDGIWLKLQEVE